MKSYSVFRSAMVVKDTTLYDVLQVSPDASEVEIKRAYHRLALQLHPDRRGAAPEGAFQALSTAFATLSDRERRSAYDRHGPQGLLQGSVLSAKDLLAEWATARSSPAEAARAEDVSREVLLSLRQAYAGEQLQMRVVRARHCPTCKGSGVRGEAEAAGGDCAECGGGGKIKQKKPIAPGVVQVVEALCGTCGGSGCHVAEDEQCETCRGERLVPESIDMVVDVPPGAPHGHLLRVAGQGNQALRGDAVGDLVVFVRVSEHDVFTREGDDLVVHREISLRDALAGASLALEHVDGTHVVLCTAPGDVIRPGDVRVVRGHGMPVLGAVDGARGDLQVHFSVRFPPPHSLGGDALAALLACLPNEPAADIVSGGALELVLQPTEV